jgi:1-deoxy-D-xylulose-5-phosphate synthase
MRFVKPLDHALVRELAFGHDLLVTIEENSVIGGAGAEVARSLEEQGLNTRLLRLGLPDRFTEHGDSTVLLLATRPRRRSIAESIKPGNT